MPSLPDRDAWQERVPSLTVTVPVGVGSPLLVNSPCARTVAVTDWPATGVDVVEVIEVEDAESPASGMTPTGILGVESPAVVWATTVTVYVVPLVSPVIVQAVALVVVHVSFPGAAVAVYPVTLCFPGMARSRTPRLWRRRA